MSLWRSAVLCRSERHKTDIHLFYLDFFFLVRSLTDIILFLGPKWPKSRVLVCFADLCVAGSHCCVFCSIWPNCCFIQFLATKRFNFCHTFTTGSFFKTDFLDTFASAKFRNYRYLLMISIIATLIRYLRTYFVSTRSTRCFLRYISIKALIRQS